MFCFSFAAVLGFHNGRHESNDLFSYLVTCNILYHCYYHHFHRPSEKNGRFIMSIFTSLFFKHVSPDSCLEEQLEGGRTALRDLRGA